MPGPEREREDPGRRGSSLGTARTETTEGSPERRRVSFEHRLVARALLAAAPGLISAVVLLAVSPVSPAVAIGWGLAVVGSTAWLALRLGRDVVPPLQVLANLVQALREGDYSLRSPRARPGDALGQVFFEVNLLGETLQRQRLETLEATTLVGRVAEEMDVALFTFDDDHRLRFVNPAGARLLGRPIRRLLGRTARELSLAPLIGEEGGDSAALDLAFPGASGRWGVRHRTFRSEGRTHDLLVVADLSRPLREEELNAWRRLIRVLGHELHNSLTPIKSMAGTLDRLLRRSPRPDDWEEDASRALDVIASRADALTRFVSAYSRLARLPKPSYRTTEVGPLVRRVVELESRLPVRVEEGPDATVSIDPDQIEQLLINLVRNAVEAVLEEKGSGDVAVRWRIAPDEVAIQVLDEGPGVSNPGNLFVPFFTTKDEGSGIGLVLARQIAEAHGGTLELENRRGRRGCRAVVRLPRRRNS